MSFSRNDRFKAVAQRHAETWHRDTQRNCNGGRFSKAFAVAVLRVSPCHVSVCLCATALQRLAVRGTEAANGLAKPDYPPQISLPAATEDVMATSTAATVEEYLAELPVERREVISKVREVVKRNLPKGYNETMSWGMISYGIPLSRFPNTYNGQPLGYVALAAQKNYYALYLMGPYMDPELAEQLEAAFKQAGKKLDIGKSCLRFKKLEDLPLEAVGRVVASMPPEKLIAHHEAVHAKR
jgi:hypothetical protein